MLFEDNIIFLILKILITYAGTMAMMFSTTSFKFVRKKSINTAMIVLCAVFSVLSTSYVLVFMGWEQLLKGFIFTISIPAVLSLYAASDEPFARLTFSHATHILFSLYIALTATLINTALHGTMLSDILLRIGFYIPVVLFDFYVLRRIWFNFLRIVRKGWGILVLIPSAFIIMFLVTGLYPDHYINRPTGILLLYLLGIVIITVYLSIGSYLFSQYRRQLAEHNRALLAIQVENLMRENAGIEALEKEMRIIRHDLRHILSTIASLAESGDTGAILDFIRKTDGLGSITIPMHYSDDPIVNATISGYLTLAMELGLRPEITVFLPSTHSVDGAGLALCFANMLEIAIHFSDKNPENDRKLTFRCSQNPEVKVEATCPVQGGVKYDRKGLPVSKDDSVTSAIRSLAAFCESNDADYSFREENGIFRITVTLWEQKEGKA